MVYSVLGGVAAMVNLAVFVGYIHLFGGSKEWAQPLAFFIAAATNYGLCIWLLFERRVKWNTGTEMFLYLLVIGAVWYFDRVCTFGMMAAGASTTWSKAVASLAGLALNFIGRRFIVFPQRKSGDWQPGQA
jgi:putative flippase GtrA